MFCSYSSIICIFVNENINFIDEYHKSPYEQINFHFSSHYLYYFLICLLHFNLSPLFSFKCYYKIITVMMSFLDDVIISMLPGYLGCNTLSDTRLSINFDIIVIFIFIGILLDYIGGFLCYFFILSSRYYGSFITLFIRFFYIFDGN